MINEEEQKDRPPTEEPRGEAGAREQEAANGNGGLVARNGATAADQPRPESQSAETKKVEGTVQSSRPTKVPRGPHPSLWPFVLALAIAVACLGVVTHPAVSVVGALLIVVAVVGWGLERY